MMLEFEPEERAHGIELVIRKLRPRLARDGDGICIEERRRTQARFCQARGENAHIKPRVVCDHDLVFQMSGELGPYARKVWCRLRILGRDAVDLDIERVITVLRRPDERGKALPHSAVLYLDDGYTAGRVPRRCRRLKINRRKVHARLSPFPLSFP